MGFNSAFKGLREGKRRNVV